MDAVRESTGDKNVKVEIFNGTYPPSPRGTVVPHPNYAPDGGYYALQRPNGNMVNEEFDSGEIKPRGILLTVPR